ncbi:MAG: GntR family transcriptional regulator [Actinobacteria bacterium]|nr:GntR family transcriptional regulator [Thermoleophilia bacterium]MCB9011496.1 GntR family transcriptional regulator [Actinomycetota bacterium]
MNASAAVAPVENVTLWERVYAHLREQILSNALSPGTVLSEVPLAVSLGVSRGPVREAIGRLAAEGLVTVRPRRSAIVSTLSQEEFLQAYQVREALETLAIRLAVPNLSDEDLDRIDDIVTRQAEAVERDDIARFFALNSEFHQLFVDQSHNAPLQDMYRQLIGHMGRYLMRSLALRGTVRRSIAEHRAIARACRTRDPERAERLLRNHIRVPQRRLEAANNEEVLLKR